MVLTVYNYKSTKVLSVYHYKSTIGSVMMQIHEYR
jgi:hypothetical protein